MFVAVAELPMAPVLLEVTGQVAARPWVHPVEVPLILPELQPGVDHLVEVSLTSLPSVLLC